MTLITDNMAGWLMKKGEISLVITGADRIAAERRRRQQDRDVFRWPCWPSNTAFPSTSRPRSALSISASGAATEIPIEERPGDEVRRVGGWLIIPAGYPLSAIPAFDVVPAKLIRRHHQRAGHRPAALSRSLAGSQEIGVRISELHARMTFLAIETSCDETAAAVLDGERRS